MQLIPVDTHVNTLLGPLAGTCCLITGASGFLGRNLIASLLATGADVHIVTHHRSNDEIPLGEHTSAHQCNLAIPLEVEALFADIRPEYVFHLATARGDSNQDRDAFLSNILIADGLIRAALKWQPRRMVIAQSSLEYGPHVQPLKETTPLIPPTLHGATKAATTLLFQQAAIEHQLPIVMLRIFSVYGYWEPWKRLIPTAMQAALSGQVLPMTSGVYRRDFVFVTDIMEAFARAALTGDVDGEIFNIGSGTQTSNNGIVGCIEDVCGCSLSIDRGAYASHITDTGFWCADNTKAQRLLNWKPRHSLNEGLAKTWKWFLEVAPRHV